MTTPEPTTEPGSSGEGKAQGGEGFRNVDEQHLAEATYAHFSPPPVIPLPYIESAPDFGEEEQHSEETTAAAYAHFSPPLATPPPPPIAAPPDVPDRAGEPSRHPPKRARARLRCQSAW